MSGRNLLSINSYVRSAHFLVMSRIYLYIQASAFFFCSSLMGHVFLRNLDSFFCVVRRSIYFRVHDWNACSSVTLICVWLSRFSLFLGNFLSIFRWSDFFFIIVHCMLCALTKVMFRKAMNLPYTRGDTSTDEVYVILCELDVRFGYWADKKERASAKTSHKLFVAELFISFEICRRKTISLTFYFRLLHFLFLFKNREKIGRNNTLKQLQERNWASILSLLML